MFTDTGDYLPREDHRVGPFLQDPVQGTSPRQALQDQPTTVLDTTGSVSQQELKGPQMRPARPLSQDGEITSGRPLSPAQRPSQTSQRPGGAQTAAGQPVRRAAAGQETARQPRVSQPAPQASRGAPAGQETARQPQVSQPTPRRTRTVHSVEIPDITQDFFAKYNDPEYVNRRLKELKEEREKEQS